MGWNWVLPDDVQLFSLDHCLSNQATDALEWAISISHIGFFSAAFTSLDMGSCQNGDGFICRGKLLHQFIVSGQSFFSPPEGVDKYHTHERRRGQERREKMPGYFTRQHSTLNLLWLQMDFWEATALIPIVFALFMTSFINIL